MTEIYVELLEEAVDVYRPVEATEISEGVFRVDSVKDDPDEVWRFDTGSLVRCRLTRLADGAALLAAEQMGEDGRGVGDRQVPRPGPKG